MQVVGHEEENVGVPKLFVVSKRDGFKNLFCNIGMAKLVCLARFAADGDEKNRARIHPGRRRMRQGFALRTIHVGRARPPGAPLG